MSCDKCSMDLSPTRKLKCGRCYQQFHISCQGFSKEKFSKLTTRQRGTWKCSPCKKNDPRSATSKTFNHDCPNRSRSLTPTYTEKRDAHEDGIATILQESQLRSKDRQQTATTSAQELEQLKAELSSKLKTSHLEIMTKLDQLMCITNAVQKKNDEVMESVNFLNGKYEELLNKFGELEALKPKVDKLKIINKELIQKIEYLEFKFDEDLQKSKANKLEIRGIPFYPSENLSSIISKIGSTIGYNISQQDVVIEETSRLRLSSRSDRNGASQEAGGARDSVAKQPPPPPTIVAFRSSSIRNTYLNAVKKHNKNKQTNTDKLNTSDIGIAGRTPIYIQEALTPRLRYLYLQTRKIARQKGYSFVWLKEGVTRAKMDSDIRIMTINHLSSLDKL